MGTTIQRLCTLPFWDIRASRWGGGVGGGSRRVKVIIQVVNTRSINVSNQIQSNICLLSRNVTFPQPPQRDALISQKGSVHKRWIVAHISAQTKHKLFQYWKTQKRVVGGPRKWPCGTLSFCSVTILCGLQFLSIWTDWQNLWLYYLCSSLDTTFMVEVSTWRGTLMNDLEMPKYR